jgi:hypothetical protein
MSSAAVALDCEHAFQCEVIRAGRLCALGSRSFGVDCSALASAAAASEEEPSSGVEDGNFILLQEVRSPFVLSALCEGGEAWCKRAAFEITQYSHDGCSEWM